MKTFRIKGHALCPVEVEMEIQAKDCYHAAEKAKEQFRKNKQLYIVANSEDYAAAYDMDFSHIVEVKQTPLSKCCYEPGKEPHE